jgi:uncharacterized membrane protein YdbT with pleckstrin-like domain
MIAGLSIGQPSNPTLGGIVMSNYLQSLLGEQEKILLLTRQHVFILISMIAAEIGIGLLIIGLVSLGFFLPPPFNPLHAFLYLLVLLPLASGTRDYLFWSNRQYIVTNRRVIQISGVVNKNVIDSSLEKVNDVKLVQSFFGRIFNYGDVEILTASEMGANLFRRIGDPVGFKTAMLNAKETLEHGALAAAPAQPKASIPELIAQLDALRQKGVLTEDEFQKKKAELLAKM